MRLLLRGGRPSRERIAEAQREPVPVKQTEPIVAAASPLPAPSNSTPLAMPLCVRIPAAAQMLAVGRSTIYELIKAGELEKIKVGAAVLIPTKSIEAFVARHARASRE
jgi:excisionase family DNA binding protein